MHVASLMAAVVALYFPPGHSVHGAVPLTSLCVPAPHATHAPPSGPVYPASQVQCERLLLPAPDTACAGHSLHAASEVSPVLVEYLPRAHRVHSPVPFTSLYVPATQASHAPPCGPV